MFPRLKAIFKDHLLLVFALVVTLAVYSKLLFFGHISWDDPEMVFRNRVVKEFDLKGFFIGHFVGNYLPLTMLVHAISWWLFENNDGGHHLVNVLLHLVNGALVYIITARLFPERKFAIITAVIFLLHPLQVESVAWISELKNTLSALFYFASIFYYLRYSESAKKSFFIFSLLFFIAGCLSKSSVVILPLTLLGLDVLTKQKISARFLLNKIPFFIISLIFGIVNLKTQAADLFINYSHAFPYHERLGYAGYAIFKYLTLFLVPHNLSVLYPYPANKVLAMVIGFALVVLVGVLFYVFYKKRSYTLLALIFLCISSLILVLQFVPFGEVLYADRYMYLPLVFFALLVLYLLQMLKVNLTYVLYFAGIILPFITFFRMEAWRNSAFLYSDILKKFPDSFVALNSLGAELMLQNDDTGSLKYLNEAVNVSPHNYKGYYNRGLLFLKNNRPKEAIADFNKAIELHDYHKAYIGRASAYYMQNDLSMAMKDANYVLEKDPLHAKALFILGNCYNSLNQLETAISYYNQSIAITGDDADFYFKRGIAFGKQQDFRSCLKDLDQAIRLNPRHFEAYYWRGVARVSLRQDPCPDLRIAAQNNVEPAVQAFHKYCR